MLEAIGHYQIRRKIGQGGMGVVYEGWDDRLKRPVAVKAILEHTESKQARGRLWREARSLAQVNHPHVCQVFDVFEEGESLVLIMELLDGQSLAERLVTGSIATSEALRIEREILATLQALHDLGIVHRDLKPSNVFLTRHGIKLLDFGLARTIDSTYSGDLDQTRTEAPSTAPGLLVGTPQYMAPEQASGLPVGPAADIFAAGTILYEMLTGRPPFEGTSVVDVLYAVLHQIPPPLSGSRAIETLDRVIGEACGGSILFRTRDARSIGIHITLGKHRGCFANQNGFPRHCPPVSRIEKRRANGLPGQQFARGHQQFTLRDEQPDRALQLDGGKAGKSARSQAHRRRGGR
jgi:serine/threonine protein kinase